MCTGPIPGTQPNRLLPSILHYLLHMLFTASSLLLTFCLIPLKPTVPPLVLCSIGWNLPFLWISITFCTSMHLSNYALYYRSVEYWSQNLPTKPEAHECRLVLILSCALFFHVPHEELNTVLWCWRLKDLW